MSAFIKSEFELEGEVLEDEEDTDKEGMWTVEWNRFGRHYVEHPGASSSYGVRDEHVSFRGLIAWEYETVDKVSVFDEVNIYIDGATESGEKAGEVADTF